MKKMSQYVRMSGMKMKRIPSRLVSAALASCLVLVGGGAFAAPHGPPAGLRADGVPMFVAIGFDDNFNQAGMSWALDELAKRKNSDGTRVRFSFFVCTEALQPSWGMGDLWRRAAAVGHEIANHTYDHNNGKDASKMSRQEWRATIERAHKDLTRPVSEGGMGMKKPAGFRAPRAEMNEHTLAAARELGYEYDCTIKGSWGMEDDWPYILDEKSGAAGMWELPLEYLAVPEAYGLARQRVWAVDMNLFDDGWGLNMTAEQGLGTLKHNLDKRLAGNRAPFVFAGHTHFMADNIDVSTNYKTTAAQRRKVYADFLDYALSKPEVRVVTHKELVDWLNDPKPLMP